jgi:hypothetical protein
VGDLLVDGWVVMVRVRDSDQCGRC